MLGNGLKNAKVGFQSLEKGNREAHSITPYMVILLLCSFECVRFVGAHNSICNSQEWALGLLRFTSNDR